jgi:hypothetical protein
MPKLTSNYVFFVLNFAALFTFWLPILHGPWAAQIDLHHMRKTFPGIEVAVKEKHFHDCLNSEKDKSNMVTVEQTKQCRDDHREKEWDEVSSLSLNSFTDGAFSFFENSKKNDDQKYWASVWHYYTTFHEYTVKYTGYRRYVKDLCSKENNECIEEMVLPVTTKSLTKEEALKMEAESGYTRHDQLGFFLQTYGKDLSMSDIMAFGGHNAKIVYLNPDNEYMTTTLDTVFWEVVISTAASNAAVTNKEAGYILNNRTKDTNKAYMSAWEADVYGVPFRKEIVFESADGKTRKKATFTTLANETSQHIFPSTTCTLCKTKLNPATPFMPVDDTGALKTGDDAIALSPATCKEAASDIMYTNIINTIWHVVLLVSVYSGFLYNKQVPEQYKEAIQFPLFALFLNAGLVNIVNISTVWKCQFVKSWLLWYLITSVFCFLIGLIFYFGVFILPGLLNFFRYCAGYKVTPEDDKPVVDAKVELLGQQGSGYMYRIA